MSVSRGSSAMPEPRDDHQQQPTPGLVPPRPQHPQQHPSPRRASTHTPIPQAHERPQPPPHSPSPAPTATNTTDQTGPSEPDHVYQAVRQAALLYSRAIMLRRPFSQVVTADEFLSLWTTAWRVPLSTWRSLLGVLNWILLPIVPSGKAAQPHDRFVKGMLNISLFQMGMDNWEIASAVMEAALSLQRWLAGDARESASPLSGAGGEGAAGRSTAWRESSGSPREGSGGERVHGRRPSRGFGDEQRRDVGKGKGLYGQGNMD